MQMFPERLLAVDPVGDARSAPVDPLAGALPTDVPVVAPALADLPPAPTPPWPINSGYSTTASAPADGAFGFNPYAF